MFVRHYDVTGVTKTTKRYILNACDVRSPQSPVGTYYRRSRGEVIDKYCTLRYSPNWSVKREGLKGNVKIYE